MADNSGMTYPLGSLRGTASGSSAAAQTRSSLPRPVSRWRLQLAITLGGSLLERVGLNPQPLPPREVEGMAAISARSFELRSQPDLQR